MGGSIYGSITEPVDLGSGGGGGRIAIYWRDAFSDFTVLEATGGTREGRTGTIFLFNGFLAGDYFF